MLIMPAPAIKRETPRLLLCQITPSDATDILYFNLTNRSHLQPWEPERTDEYFTLAATRTRLEGMQQQMVAGSALYWLIRDKDNHAVVGQCGFSNIVRGPFQACHLGFAAAAAAQGRGYMQEALESAISFVFEHYGLHRVMANYRPENVRSAKLLARLGFEIEGQARAYLKINGQWADHVLTSRIAGDLHQCV